MIVYDRFWRTLKEKGVSQYRLIHDYHFSAGQLSRMRKNAHLSTYTLDTLCKILHCRIEDIVEYRDEGGEPEEPEEPAKQEEQ